MIFKFTDKHFNLVFATSHISLELSAVKYFNVEHVKAHVKLRTDFSRWNLIKSGFQSVL